MSAWRNRKGRVIDTRGLTLLEHKIQSLLFLLLLNLQLAPGDSVHILIESSNSPCSIEHDREGSIRCRVRDAAAELRVMMVPINCMKHELLVSLEHRWREQQMRQEQRSAGIERPVTSMNHSRSDTGHNHVVRKDLLIRKSRGYVNTTFRLSICATRRYTITNISCAGSLV